MSQSFDGDFYHSACMANALERACLRRPFQLGMLYDCHKDKLLPGKPLWDIEPGKDGYSSKPQTQNRPKFVISSDDSFEWKCEQLKIVDSGTKLGLLSDWVDFQGASKLLRDSKPSKRQARVILACKLVSKMDEIVPTQSKADLAGALKSATHVVIGVLYGIDMFFVFNEKVCEEGNVATVQASLEDKVRTLLKPQGFSKKPTTRTESVTIKYYGDLKLDNQPTTFEEVARLCHDVPKMLEKLNVPMRVWLHPLGQLEARTQQSSVLEISETVTDMLQKLIKSLHEFEVRGNDLSNRSTCFHFVEIKENLSRMGRLVKSHREEVQKCLFDSLSRVRSGLVDESELVGVLEMNKASPFNCQYLSSWFDEKDKEVNTLDNYLKQLQQEHIQFAFTDIEDYLSDAEVETIFCFDFNIVQEDSNILQMMEDCNNGRKVSQEVATPHPWHKDRRVVQDMREQIRRFKFFVKNNIERKQTKFLITNGESRSANKVGVILLFLGGSPTEFEPPDKPGKPVELGWSNNTLSLSWEVPKYGAESVESYTIMYCSERDLHGKWCTATSLRAQVALPGLLPDTKYSFKVKAETSAGASPESIVSSIKTPPEQPCKPRATKVTHDSVFLEWEKPTQESSSTLSYTIMYRSSHEPAVDKWHTQVLPTAQRNALLSGLASKTTYYCKVKAETIDGITIESEVSDPIETMVPIGQPSKPYATCVTENSLELKWSKPKLAATSIQHYSIAYKSVHETQEEWHMQATTSSQEYALVSNLDSGTSYLFKVCAITSIGCGPESDLSELIKTKMPISQPGKPHVSNVTHTLLKLKWDCPAVGASSVLSYTIFYCSESIPHKWHTQQTQICTQNQVATVTNLTPNTAYRFKVRAETATGPGPESELSDPIKTTLPPPGKLQVSNVSHDSIELSWEKPNCGNESVQFYTVYFRSENDSSDKWHSRDTKLARESIVLDNLSSNMAYYFKVRAETAVGFSQKSKVCGPIRTIVPPPDKPTVSRITCNSVLLDWKTSKSDSGIVESYTVSYRYGDNKWNMQTTSNSVHSLNITDLLPGRIYHFKVKAKTATGFSRESSITEVMLPPDQPSKPRALKVYPNSIQLQWSKPTNGADTVQCYKIWYCSTHSDQWSSQLTTSAQESALLVDLTPKMVYYAKVQAVSIAGTSPEGAVSDPIETLLPPPGKPYAANVSFNSVQLRWEKPQRGAENVTSYTIFYCEQSGLWQERKTHTAQENLNMSFLSPKKIYRFKVRAETATGSSLESELSDPIETILSPPSKPFVSMKTHNSIQLTWKKPPSGFECVHSYTIFFRLEHDSPDKWSSQKTSQAIESFEFTKLALGGVYLFKVRAESAAGCSVCSDINKVILPSGQPGTPQIAGRSVNSVFLTWAKPTHGATSVQTYTVLYRSTADPVGKWSTSSTQRAEVSMNVLDLLPGAAYNFKVKAESAGGSSLVSEAVEAILPPDQPGKPQASAVFHDKIELKWCKPTHGAQIVGSYIISYRSVSSSVKNWSMHISPSSDTTATIVGLTPKVKYIFKLKAETNDAGASPMSDDSDPIETLLPPPGKPYATNVSYEDFLINWQKPKCKGIQYYTIFYRAVDDPDDKWYSHQTTGNKNTLNFTAHPGVYYAFKVSALTSEGLTSESEVSAPFVTKAKPWGAQLINSCKKIASKQCESPTYQLPLKTTMRKKDIAKVVVGEIPSKRSASPPQHKVLMLVGATGAGKSTLINGIANYIMGVDWEDEYRFKLISEDCSHDQTRSQTRCITAYTFYREEAKGSFLQFTLTVIDTPGFGDTGGLDRDKQIVKQIKEFFSIKGDEGINQLHGIGFVTQAPLARLTPTQRYVFDSILAVFGKDVADNIFLMVTFADGKQPPVVDAVKAAAVPFNNFFKFNNSALFASNQSSDEFDKMFWKMGKNSFQDFFDRFSRAKTQSLQQSREVLQQREQLEITIQGLQPQIRAGLAKIDELRQERQLLKDHEADIITHKDFTYQVHITKQRKIDLPKGRYTTNCLKCNFTCHDDCIYPNDGDKFKCSAMSKQGEQDAACRVCPDECSWRDHVCNPYRFEIYQEPEIRTSKELKAKYESAMTDKGEVEAVMKKMKMELKDMDRAVLMKIQQAKRSLQRLEEIALRPGHLTEVEYIDILIESEQREARPGWKQRVKALHEVRKQAEIVTDIRSTKGEKFDQFFDEQPDPEQQQVGMWGKFKSMWS